MDIKSLINKVIASKGILRVPSWWMKKLLTEIVGYIDSRDSATAKSIDNINTEISHIKNLSLPYMLVSGTGIVNINNSDTKFSNANKHLIYITGPIKFTGGYNVSYIYIPHIDVRSQGTCMSNMFYYCSSLTSLDLSGFDTSAVTNMSNMFSRSSLTSLDLSSLDTSAVTNMSNMFSSSSLTSLDLSSLDTSAVTDMGAMFYGCDKLTSLDLSGFDTSSVTDMGAMFSDCWDLTSLDLSTFDTSAVTDMSSMFYDCWDLTSLDLGPNFFKTSAVTSIDFSDCSKWTNDTVITSLVTNSYDRASAGLNTLTLQLRANTKAVLSNEQKAAITSKGYTIA